MNIVRHDPHPMTAEEFFAFTEMRPEDGKWELIDGEPVLNPSPTRLHQRILGNLLSTLKILERSQRRGGRLPWEVLPGIGVRISNTDALVPDFLIRPFDDFTGVECDDMIAAFEVLSPSTADHDLRWKRQAYATLASLQHYVVVAQDAAEVVVFDRQRGFAERRLEGLGATLDLPMLNIALPLAEIYRDTGLERKP
ncbi:MAG: Uma2 family endonuclease [Methylovirgula sp.]